MREAQTRVIAAVVGIAAAVPLSAGAAVQDGWVTLKHTPTKLTISAPRGFTLSFSKGVYVIKGQGQTVVFSRSVTGVGANTFGAALLRALGGKVVYRGGGPAEFAARVERSGRRDAFVIARANGGLTITTASSRTSSLLDLEALRSIGRSASGGVSLRAPASSGAVKSIPLRAYRTADGGASGLVPVGWTVDGANGNMTGFSANGAFAFGLSINVPLPGVAPGQVPAGILTAPYMNAATALQQFIPRLFKVSNVKIRGVIHDAVFPSFTSSGMLRFDYTSNGQRWTGAAIVATDSPAKYGNLAWNLYYSGIGVRVGTDPSVGVGLLKAWKSWDPSGAIAARTRQQIQLVDETAAVWQQASEFRSVTADRQSRDVGCLLQGYYVIEDNSRAFGLPPLPCGQVYTR
jgi:hypothetical protein